MSHINVTINGRQYRMACEEGQEVRLLKLAESLGYVLVKKVGAPAGTTLVLDMTGSEPFAFAVSDAGRGERLDAAPKTPTVTLRMDRESFIRLAGRRCDAEPGAVTVEGDSGLGERVLATMATTP